MNGDICHSNLVENLIPIAELAGEAIMRVHRQGVVSESKTDGSPVTEADRAAEKIILHGLQQIAPDIAVVSEEDAQSHAMAPPSTYFLVDPLDGTREFLRSDGAGDFTVNIALIRVGNPVLGLIFAPARNELYWGIVGQEAHRNGERISVRNAPEGGLTALASRSHRDADTNAWLAENGINNTCSIGSSLKFCLLARGEADVYPRFGPTMEWDTAAGHAILVAAGGSVSHPDGRPFTYGKPGYRNGPFIAWARELG